MYEYLTTQVIPQISALGVGVVLGVPGGYVLGRYHARQLRKDADDHTREGS